MKDFNQELARALRKLATREEFFGRFMSNFNYFESEDSETVDYYIDPCGYINCLVNPNMDVAKLVDELKHVALHLIKDVVPDVHPVTTLERVYANIAFDASAADGTGTWHGFPTDKQTLFYYKRLLNVDLAEDGYQSLRVLDPKFATEIEMMIDDPDKHYAEIKKHLFWLEVQKYDKEPLADEIIYIARNAVVEVAENTYKGVGAYPDGLAEYFKFDKKAPKLNWGRLVRKHLGTNLSEEFKSTHRKESKRFPGGTGHCHKKNPEILVLLDTSGSIGKSEFQEFFREIDAMARRGYEPTVVEIDGNLENIYKYKKGMCDKIEVHGRGGTNLKAACDYWNAHRNEFAAGVLFTDGWDNVSECKPLGNFMWVISSSGYQEACYPGKTLFIPKED